MFRLFNMRSLRKQRGDALLVSAILTCIVVSVIGLAIANINMAANTGAIGAATAQQARWYAESKANEVNVTSYSNIASMAASRATISGTAFDREVTVGTETTVNGVKETPVTVNVYKTGQSTALASLVLTPTSASSGSTSVSHGAQLFTSSGTFTVPSGINTVYVSMCGGGGGGGGGRYGSPNCSFGGGGGAGAAVLKQKITGLTAGQNISVTVGGGGIGGTTDIGVTNGSAGGASSFGSYLSCVGGGGGYTPSSAGSLASGGGSGGSGGGVGMPGIPKSNYQTGGGGVGGSGIFCGAAPGATDGSSNGSNGCNYGGGGGGAGGYYTGGTGAPGMVLVEW